MNDKFKNEILIYLPNNIKNFFYNIAPNYLDKLTEIRFVCGSPIIIKSKDTRNYLGSDGLSRNCKDIYNITENDIKVVVELLTKSSIYTYDKYINRGFIPLPGGHRAGIVGNTIVNNNEITNVKEFNSIVIRIAHEIPDASDFIFDDIFSGNEIKNTVIISPPGCGKTTLLRSLAYKFSESDKLNKIIVSAIIDERFEIAASYFGRSNLSIGINNFVMSGCDKSLAIPLVVRSMSPDIIIVDEMCSVEDVLSAKYAIYSGCKIIASVHGFDEYNNELTNFDINNLFDTVIVLSNRCGPGTVEKIIGCEVK